MTRAIEMIEKYLVPALDYMHNLDNDEESIEKWVADHIVTGNEETITLSDVKRSARRRTEHLSAMQQTEAILAALAMLERLQWIAKTEETRQTTRYLVNPSIREKFKKRRDEVVRIKQGRLDRTREIITATGIQVDRRLARGMTQ